MAYITVNQLAIMCRDEGRIEGRSFTQISPDFLPQDRMDVYVYGDAVVGDMHDAMLFRSPTSLVVPLKSRVAFHVM